MRSREETKELAIREDDIPKCMRIFEYLIDEKSASRSQTCHMTGLDYNKRGNEIIEYLMGKGLLVGVEASGYDHVALTPEGRSGAFFSQKLKQLLGLEQ